MRDKTIRVFIKESDGQRHDGLRHISISPFSSFYSLKHELNINPTTTLLDGCRQLTPSSDNVCIHELNIADGSILSVMPKGLLGGSNATLDLLWIGYYLALIAYVLFLVSGLLPVIASIFASLFNSTVFALLDRMTQSSSPIARVMRIVLKVIGWLLSNFSVLFIVWALSGYIIFPWLYGRASKFCESALVARSIGWWTMVLFMVVYGSLNLVDAVITITQSLTAEMPGIFDATLSPSLMAFKEIWDISKFGLLYLVPGVDFYHMLIEQAIYALFTAATELQILDCSDPAKAGQLCDLMTKLRDQSTTGRPKTAIPTTQAGLNGLIGQIALAPARTFINNYKMGPALELLSVGFCDKAALAEKLNLKQDPTGDGRYVSGSFNRWSSGLFSSFFCQMIEAVNDMMGTIYDVGSDDQIANMIKTGNFAGMVSGTYFIIMVIYTGFASSLSGYSYA